MDYKRKLEKLRKEYRTLFEKLNSNSEMKLPRGVDKKKLEAACDKISNEYVWVLKRRSDIARS